MCTWHRPAKQQPIRIFRLSHQSTRILPLGIYMHHQLFVRRPQNRNQIVGDGGERITKRKIASHANSSGGRQRHLPVRVE